METFTLPMAIFNDENYKTLSYSAQSALFLMYAKNYDCDTFTIPIRASNEYGYRSRSPMNKKMTELIQAGFLIVVGIVHTTQCRIFEFKHKAVI